MKSKQPTAREILEHVLKMRAEGCRPIRSVLKKYNRDRIEYWWHLRAKEIQTFGDAAMGAPLTFPHPSDIRTVRLQLLISQKEAADIAGVTELQWQKWETEPTQDSWDRIDGAAWDRFLNGTEHRVVQPIQSDWH